MNLKIYKRTRYQNIYQHIKNKNYLVLMSKPVKSSISTINGEKIWKIEDAVKIRDNPKIKLQKGAEIHYKDNFDDLWDKYIEETKNVYRHAYNTYHRKEVMINRFFKGKLTKPISKYNKDFFSKYIDELDTTTIVKNTIIKYIKTFFAWCVENEYILINPMQQVKFYKVPKSEMKYWLPEHIKKILETIEYDIENAELQTKHYAYLVKMIILIGFSLGDRIGETRALLFGNVSIDQQTIQINHSINYDTSSDNYLSSTKTKSSNDILHVTKKLITEIFKYRDFLKDELNYNIDDNTPIFINVVTRKPFSDSMLRKYFNYYIEKADIPKIRMYDLRHTTATTLMSLGYDMYDIKDRLRHSSIKTTIDKYGHITSEKRKEIAKATDQFI